MNNNEFKTDAELFDGQVFAENFPGGVCMCSVYDDGHIVTEYLNATFYSIMNTTREAGTHYLTASPDSFIHETDWAVLHPQLTATVKNGTPANADIRVRLADGTYRWCNVRSSLVRRIGSRTVLGLLITNVDAEHAERVAALESRKALQFASQQGSIAMWVYNLDTKCISQPFNEQGSFGFAVEFKGGYDEIIAVGGIHPDDIKLYRDMYARIDGGAQNSECTVRVYDKNGDKYEWQRLTLMRQPKIEGEAPTAIGLSVNVELQKDAEVRYEREMRLRRELVKDAVIYYRINLNTKMVEELYSEAYDASDTALPISFDALSAAGMFDGVYPPDAALLKKMLNPENMLANYHSGKISETFSYRRYLPGKGLRWLKASIAKLKRVSSDDVIAFFTGVDIDDEMKDQILYRSVMDEEIESLITMKTTAPMVRVLKENRVLPGYNPSAPAAGYFPLTEEFRSALFGDMCREDIAKADEFIKTENILKGLAKKPVLQITYRTSAGDGANTVRRKKVRVFYLDETKQDIIFARRDITDLYNEQQRQSAAIKRAMDEATTANNAKSVFLSRMSHDMRTPLNAIIGYSGSVLRDGATEAQKDEFLDDIHASGEYLLGIINDVLDMTKIESNKMVLHKEPYAASEFKENVCTVINPLCDKKGVTFNFNVPEDAAEPVMLDKVRYNQIFINLLSNSVKFTPPGGTITLSAGFVGRDEHMVDAIITVSDNGCGMSKEFLPHAFDSFSQEYSAQTMHNEQGTGLGLSIVKQLVELMGGTITVESELGKGSTFTVSMPMQLAGAEVVDMHRTFPKNGLNGLHLLLCEDHPMNRKIAIRLLEKEGCTIDTAADGALGVAAFKSSPLDSYDAVLMDIRMPNMDGLEAAKAIRGLQREDAQSVPIIAMTANAFTEDRRASFAAGMNGHIAKPIDPQEMYSTIYNLTSTRHMARTPKILIVDDIAMNAALIARVLKGEYETIIAKSGEEALEQLKTNPYIIGVITDVQMPGMDGGQLIRAIRQNPAYNRIALIANTQYGSDETEEALMRDGADDFIYKPTAPSLIRKRVNNVLAKYR